MLNLDSWNYQVKAFNESNYRVLRYSELGHGKTKNGHKCEVPDSKISTTFHKGFIKDFSNPIYKNKPEAMCKWANYHNVPWIGIDHLCLKNQN